MNERVHDAQPTDDEARIRQLVATWIEASKGGDLDTVLSLVTDDVVFLTAGRPPMRKAEFAAASRAQSGPAAPRIDATSAIQEIRVAGDWAFMWTQLAVVVTPADGAAVTRTGHTLTVLRREDGRWRIARDANMLAVVPQAPSA